MYKISNIVDVTYLSKILFVSYLYIYILYIPVCIIFFSSIDYTIEEDTRE